MAGYPVQHTPVSGEKSLPKHDVTEGFFGIGFSQEQAPCIDLHESGLQQYVSGSTLSQHGVVSYKPERNYRTNSKIARCLS